MLSFAVTQCSAAWFSHVTPHMSTVRTPTGTCGTYCHHPTSSHDTKMAFINVRTSQLRRGAHGSQLCSTAPYTLTSPLGLQSSSWPHPVTSSSYTAPHPCLWDNSALTLPHLPFCFPQSF